jgi:23S rRNA (uridine2552-2'-O)-methyltransferase
MPQPRKLHDKFFKQAKAEGYVARSAYKLIEINEKKRLIRRGAKVLDLGCAPGSWLQVVEEIVGARGAAVGVDLQRVDLSFGPNVHVLQADAFTIDPEQLTGLTGGLFDAVISDMAPNTTGHGDDFLSVRLCRRVLELLPRVLRPGGAVLMKVLEGEEFPRLLRETKRLFRDAGATKPAASRDVSREIFIVGSGYAAPAGAAAPR